MKLKVVTFAVDCPEIVDFSSNFVGSNLVMEVVNFLILFIVDRSEEINGEDFTEDDKLRVSFFNVAKDVVSRAVVLMIVLAVVFNTEELPCKVFLADSTVELIANELANEVLIVIFAFNVVNTAV